MMGGWTVRKPRKRLPETLRAALPTALPLSILVIAALVAVFASLLAPYDPNDQSLDARLESPSLAHPLGTDHLGAGRAVSPNRRQPVFAGDNYGLGADFRDIRNAGRRVRGQGGRRDGRKSRCAWWTWFSSSQNW